MSAARHALLARVIDEAATHGLADRSLRDIADAAGTSHRMLLYHFHDRAGLVAAVVESLEAAQRDALIDLATQADSAETLIRALWRRVAAPEMRPFVRLFFECVATGGGTRLTDPWFGAADQAGDTLGEVHDPDRIRLGIAVIRGLLIDVVTTGEVDDATRALDEFVEMWRASGESHHAP